MNGLSWLPRTWVVQSWTGLWGSCVLGMLASCTLQMPKESEAFSQQTAGSGAGGASAGSTSTAGSPEGGASSGGSVSLGGNASGGSNTGGSNSGGSDSGGVDSGGADTGGAAAGGSTTLGGTSAVAGSGGRMSTGGVTSNGGTAGQAGNLSFDPDRGLVAHFPLDDSANSILVNQQNPRQNGTCEGTCTHPTGRYGKAVGIRNLADGTLDYIELPANLLSGLSELTLSLWIRDLSTARQGARLFHFGSPDRGEIYFSPDDESPMGSVVGAHLGGTQAGGPFVDLWTTQPLTDKDWHHVAVSWSAARIDLYVDADSVGSQLNPEVLPSDLGTASPNWLGRTKDDSFIALYAEIDDLRIYDRALTPREVSQLHNLAP